MKWERLSEQWFVAVLNSLPKPYSWSKIEH